VAESRDIPLTYNKKIRNLLMFVDGAAIPWENKSEDSNKNVNFYEQIKGC
jgi:hypothetical protein